MLAGKSGAAGPKYVPEKVTSVADDVTDDAADLKFNNKYTWTKLSSSTTISKDNARVLLRFLDTDAVTDVKYSFPLKGGRQIEIDTKSNTAAYTLMAGSTEIYSGTTTTSKADEFKINDKGQLLGPNGQVILQNAVSSAFTLRTIVPSIVAILAAVMLL